LKRNLLTMIELANLFSLSPAFSIATFAVAGIGGFVAGYLLKAGIIAKHKKRVLNLENEMLSNHSRILALEKQITELKNETAKTDSKKESSSKLRAS
jgi:hypothetical protein